MKHGVWHMLGVALAALCLTVGQARADGNIPEPALDEMMQAGIDMDSLGIFVLPVNGGTPLISHHAKDAFQPASTMKVVTTYVALETLGSGYRWTTRAYAVGRVADGTLHGDLIIRGSGDPTFSDASLWQFIRSIQDHGVYHISGNVILDRSVFARDDTDPAAFDGRPFRPYNATSNGLLLNDKRVAIQFVPDVERGTLSVTVEPRMDGLRIVKPEPIDEECGDWKDGLSVEFTRNTLEIGGSYPLSCGEKTLTYHPYLLSDTQYFESVFRQLWRESGGSINGAFREGRATGDEKLLAQWNSPSLPTVLAAINKFSNNVKARQLLMTLGTLSKDEGITPDDGIREIKQWLRKRGIETQNLVMENGSGLSRKEKMTPETMADILRLAHESPLMPEFVSSLPIIGRDGTMRKRLADTEVAGMGHIKTGLLNEARAVAGYLRAKSGHEYIVVCMINGEEAMAGRQVIDRLLTWVYGNG